MSTQADVAPRTSSSVPAPNSSSACQKYKYKPRKRVYVIYYSMYGHILKMAKAIVAGLEKAGGFFLLIVFFIIIFSPNKSRLKFSISFKKWKLNYFK